MLREPGRLGDAWAEAVESSGSAAAIVEQEHGLLAAERLRSACAELDRWTAKGIRACSIFDPDYPENLRAARDRPALIFLLGDYETCDVRSVAVIGARRASRGGLERARAVAAHLVGRGYTVVSGLAAGIDTAAHTAALEAGGRTVAVVGSGVLSCYPPENAGLQRRIAAQGAVVSQFLPATPPTRESFLTRNAVMSGISVGTVVVEASETSGARAQARLARAQGRPVFLARELLGRDWARRLADGGEAYVFDSPAEITTIIDGPTRAESLVA